MSLFHKDRKCPALNKDGTTELDEACLDAFLAQSPKVVLMFYRANCGHSAKMEPIYAQLCAEMGQGMSFCKVDTTRNPALVKRYQVKGTPTFVIVHGGKALRTIVGERSKESLSAGIVGAGEA